MTCEAMLTAGGDEPLETALAALSCGYVTIEQLQDAASKRRQRRPVIGRLGLKQGLLSMAQVFRILEQQAITGELFGEIAVRLRFLSEVELYKLLDLQSHLAPMLADVLVREGYLSAEQRAEIAEQVKQRLQDSPRLTDSRLTI